MAKQKKSELKQIIMDEVSKSGESEIYEYTYIKEGQKVKLNYENITSHPDYNYREQRYKDFVENNKDKILTVVYDKQFGRDLLVCLKEDKTKLKWLWNWQTDLIVQ